MMMDPEIIDEKLSEARLRDKAVFDKLLHECARLVVVDQHRNNDRMLSLDQFANLLRPARFSESGRFNPNDPAFPHPENGSFAYQFFSAVAFAIDARAELKLLELIASPHFYSALTRSAAEQP
jgi:hypothetical protein